MTCPATRAGAFAQLHSFLPSVPDYARNRNRVETGHTAVSRLSPAIRHRLLTEDEVAQAVLQSHPLAAATKFIQEVYWRTYWKSWLSLRPQVWENYTEVLGSLGKADLSHIESANTGNPVIDHFARVLMDTGYLHNHARMWFAAWWIHAAGLPWQSGAAFFHRFLLDGDPASNTLSWRWVAGLQTPGKAYLARKTNLQSYLSADLLTILAGDWSDFESPVERIPESTASHQITCAKLEEHPMLENRLTGLWIHEDDLSAETSPLGASTFSAITVTAHLQSWEDLSFPETKRQWLHTALADAAQRAEAHWQTTSCITAADNLANALVDWALTNKLQQIATLRPFTGPLADALPSILSALQSKGIHLALTDRPRDLAFRPLATAGFFKFWESILKNSLLPLQHP